MPQIITNFKNKSTGQLAFVTFLLNWFGAFARCITIFVESEDPAFRAQGMVAVSLTSTLITQFFLYRHNCDEPDCEAAKRAALIDEHTSDAISNLLDTRYLEESILLEDKLKEIGQIKNKLSEKINSFQAI